MEVKQTDIKQLKFYSDYSSEDSKREKLYPLFEKVFGIEVNTLRELYKRGFWNESYIPYTFFNNDQAIANVSAFPLDMNIEQSNKKCVGIQSVMTEPDYRKKGLMKRLFSKMLEDIDQKYEAAFLFTSNPELYIPYGFKVIEQYYFRKNVNHHLLTKKTSLRKLEPLKDSDIKILMDLLKNREALSKVFAPLSYENAIYFNLYNSELNNKFFLIEELNTIVVFDVKEGTLRIFDVISREIPSLEILCSYLPHQFNTIEFYFNPDAFNLENVVEVEYKTENKLMFRGSYLLENQFIMMPLTAEF